MQKYTWSTVQIDLATDLDTHTKLWVMDANFTAAAS
jgi:hypothetical protein